MKTWLRKGGGGLPDRFFMIYAKTTAKEIGMNWRTISFRCLQSRINANAVIKNYSYGNTLYSPMGLRGLQQFSEIIRG